MRGTNISLLSLVGCMNIIFAQVRKKSSIDKIKSAIRESSNIHPPYHSINGVIPKIINYIQ